MTKTPLVNRVLKLKKIYSDTQILEMERALLTIDDNLKEIDAKTAGAISSINSMLQLKPIEASGFNFSIIEDYFITLRREEEALIENKRRELQLEKEQLAEVKALRKVLRGRCG